MYTRAAASDYDDWEKIYKNPGWGSQDLIPLLQKAETFDRTAPFHGDVGPLKISYRESEINVADDFLGTAGKYDKKRSRTEDVNGFFSCDAYGVISYSYPGPNDAR
jgi:alcohol oxidase